MLLRITNFMIRAAEADCLRLLRWLQDEMSFVLQSAIEPNWAPAVRRCTNATGDRTHEQTLVGMVLNKGKRLPALVGIRRACTDGQFG